MDQLLLLASLAEAWGPRGEALGARVPQERLSALLPLVRRQRGVLPPPLDSVFLTGRSRLRLSLCQLKGCARSLELQKATRQL